MKLPYRPMVRKRVWEQIIHVNHSSHSGTVEDIELDLEKSISRQHNVNDMYDKLERYKEEVES